jgi:hypothetical protein
MTPAEQLITRELHAFADIPVTERDVRDAHDELRARLRAVPVRHRSTRVLIAAAAVVVLVLGLIAVRLTGLHPPQLEPARHPDRPDAAAVRTANDFVHAFASADVPRAKALLTPQAPTTGDLDGKDWASVSRYFQAAEGRFSFAQPCRVVTRTGAETTVRCPYRYQLLGSARLGLGPYRGSYFEVVTKRDRVTLAFMHFEYRNGFNTQVWAPFATWMNTAHPHDAAQMYPDWPLDSQWGYTRRALQLWSQRTRDYVDHVRSTCAATPRPGTTPGGTPCR